MKKGLTFQTLVGFDDIQKEFELVFNEQKELIKLIMGDNYGIVSETDVKGESPLYPTLNENVLSVTEGKIVTKNGDTTTVEEFSKEIGSFSEDLAVLFVYEMVGSKEKRISNDGNALSVWYDRKEVDDSIMIIKASLYDSLSDELKNNSICICIVKYSITKPYIDLTNSEYKFNRPWFSPTDIAHRLEKGTGNPNVPHSIGINDLASSNVTLYNQLLSRGMIVSKDVSISGVPGKSYKISAVSNNDLVELDCYPNAIGYCNKKEDGAGDDIPCFLREGTNIAEVEEYYYDGEIWMDVVLTRCLMPPVQTDSINTELTFGANEDNDIIITEGKQVELIDNKISFSNCGQLSKSYEVVFGADGKLHKEPDVIGFTSLLSQFKTKTFNQEYSIPVRINIPLMLDDVSSYDIKITITGTVIDENGDRVDGSETMEWSTVTNTAPKNNTSTKLFTRILEIKVDGSDIEELTSTKITIFAVADNALDNRLKVAIVNWNYSTTESDEEKGRIDSIKDIRPIATTLRDPFELSDVKETGMSMVNSLYLNQLSSSVDMPTSVNAKLIIVEDFRKVSYLCSQTVNWRITPYGINYPIINNNIFDSRTITDCYRSRRIGIEKEIHNYCVILINSDYETSHNYSVRLGFYDTADKYYETPMFPVVDNNKKIEGNGMFLLKVVNNSSDSDTSTESSQLKHLQVIVSGKASGFILLQLTNMDNNEQYEVELR